VVEIVTLGIRDEPLGVSKAERGIENGDDGVDEEGVSCSAVHDRKPPLKAC